MADIAETAARDQDLETAKLGVLLYLDNASRLPGTQWQVQGMIVGAVQRRTIELYVSEDGQETRRYVNPFQVSDTATIKEALRQLKETSPALIEESEYNPSAPNRRITDAGKEHLRQQMEARGTTREEVANQAVSSRSLGGMTAPAQKRDEVPKAGTGRKKTYRPVAADPETLDRDAVDKAKMFILQFLDNARKMPQTSGGKTLGDLELALASPNIQLRAADSVMFTYRNRFRVPSRAVPSIRAVVTAAIEELLPTAPPLIQQNEPSGHAGITYRITDAGIGHWQRQIEEQHITMEPTSRSPRDWRGITFESLGEKPGSRQRSGGTGM